MTNFGMGWWKTKSPDVFFTSLTGVLGYTYSNFKLLPEERTTYGAQSEEMDHPSWPPVWTGCAIHRHGEPSEIPPDIQNYLDDFRAAVSEVNDARLVFSRREWVNGNYRPYQEFSMAFRKSGDIYIRFSGDSSQGREILWRPTVDGSYMLVKPSPILPVLKLDPMAHLQRKTPATRLVWPPFHALADRILNELDKLTQDPNLNGEYQNLGTKTVKERRSGCFQVDCLGKRSDPLRRSNRHLFGPKVQSSCDTQAWNMIDGQYLLVEDYSWTQVQINLNLDDAVFDPENPSYNF